MTVRFHCSRSASVRSRQARLGAASFVLLSLAPLAVCGSRTDARATPAAPGAPHESRGGGEEAGYELRPRLAGAEDERYAAANRAHGLVAEFAPGGGVRVRPRSGTEAWSWSLDLLSCGREGASRAVAPPTLRVEGNRATYVRGELHEWYVNDAAGLEQGFTLGAAPAGNPSLPVRVEMRVGGTLDASLGEDRRSSTFRDPRTGSVALSFGGLHAFDAAGRELPARMSLEGDRLSIEVDDQGARYPIVIDPLVTSPVWSEWLGQQGARFGYAVAGAGDVDGDGDVEVLVTALNYDNGQSNEGAVFLYASTNTGLDPNWIWSAEGNQAGCGFGNSASTAGDVNGDGYDDFLVGAPNYTNGAGQTGEGRAFLYLGAGNFPASTPAWTAESNQFGGRFGIAVGPAGDVNGDGFSDVIVGANGYDNGQTDEGRAYVFHGSAAGLSTTPAWTVESDVANAFFGSAVATAGDVNADGYSDVVVGAYSYDAGLTDQGRAYVYLGSASGLSATPHWTAAGGQATALFGVSVATAGDVNGDGYADVAVGARQASNGQSAEGRVYVYLGSSGGLSPSAAWIGESNVAGAEYGASVTPAGDANGDGYGDLAIGAPAYLGSTGRVYLYEGSPAGLPAIPTSILDGTQTNARFGASIATVGDDDADGFCDLLVGADLHDSFANPPNHDDGMTFLFRGRGRGLTGAPTWTAYGAQAAEYLGTSVAVAGDVDGDGFDDVVVGSVGNAPRATLHRGSVAGLSAQSSWSVGAPVGSHDFGRAVARAGDVDGDGYGDVLVADPGYLGKGRAYLYRGSPSGPASTPAWTADGSVFGAAFGVALGSAGDVDGDGYGDVWVRTGAFQAPANEVSVFHGGPSGLASVPGWTTPVPAGDPTTLVSSVAGAGDVNRDGYSDLVIGRKYLQGSGQVAIHLGSPLGISSTPAFVVSGSPASEFGAVVDSAGDVDADGFGDVLVAAHAYTNGQTNEGAVYLYGGSASGALSLRKLFEGNLAFSEFGASVSGAGDVDGDKRSEILVGRPTPGTTGGAHLYSYADPTIDAVFTGSLHSSFGWSVTGAGDFDGDGYGDVVVGAPLHVQGGLQTGAAHAYHGNADSARSTVHQQRRSDGSAPIAPLGLSSDPASLRLRMTATSPYGRVRLKLDSLVTLLGSPPFLPVWLQGTSTLDTGLSGVVVDELRTVGPATGRRRWQLRAHYLASSSPYLRKGRPLTLQHNGVHEADFGLAAPPPAVVRFCGDGEPGIVCPCTNDVVLAGCPNSTGGAAELDPLSGVASLAADSLTLISDGLPATALAIPSQGTTQVVPSVFGDGIRCVGGALKRLYTLNAVAGGLQFPPAGGPSISARSSALGDPISAGEHRYYYVYYRDPDPAFCLSATYNISNALMVLWAP